MSRLILLNRAQVWLILLVVVFCAVQFLPHRMPQLSSSAFALFYVLIALLLGVIIVLGLMITAAMWLFTHDETSRRRRRNWFLTFALMVSAACVLWFGEKAFARGLPAGSFLKPFNQELWAAPSSSEFIRGDITLRQKMLGSTVKQVVMGNTKQEIIAKLGPPESKEHFSSLRPDLIYCTGPQRSYIAIDSEWLLIWFDSDGRASRFEVWSD